MQPTGIIWDIDGVLADSEIRKQFEEEAANGDFTWFERKIPHFRSHRWAIEMINALARAGNTILFVTARDEKYRAATVSWLNKVIETRSYKLMMREGAGEDAEIKRGIYEKKIKDRYKVLAAFDDQKPCIDMWRSLGITALHNKNEIDA